MENIKIFKNSEYRVATGSKGFHEIQYCEKNLPIKKLLHYKNIVNWKSDSLYIEAMTKEDEIFYNYYDKIFSQFGKLEYVGDNYFTKKKP